MNQDQEKTMPCPRCQRAMHFEARRRLEFVNGRGMVELDRFHCSSCRTFHNEPVPAQPAQA